MNREELQQIRDRLVEGYNRMVPHNGALGTEVVTADEGLALVRLDYRDEFLGDREVGLWHTAVTLSLVDGACGLAVLLGLPQLEGIATLDLRADFLRPAVKDKPLFTRAECYHVTRCIAFARADVYQDDPGRPTAYCTAAFMRTSSSQAIK